MKAIFILVGYCLLLAPSMGQQASSPAVQWQRVFGSYEREAFTTMIQTRDGGYLLGGSSDGPPGGTKTAQYYSQNDYWIVRLGAQGEQLWDASFGGSSLDYLETIVETPDGGFILGGSSWSTNTGNKSTGHFGPNGSEDYWFLRLDMIGGKIWEQNIGGNRSDFLRKIELCPDGGFFLCGASSSSISGTKTATNYGTRPSHDYWVVKTDSGGQMLWDKSYGGADSDLAWCAQLTRDGGLILGGASQSEASGTKTSAKYGGYDFWVVRTDANGNQIWDASCGGANDDTMYCVAEMSDGGFILGGRSDSSPSGNKTSPNRGGFDFLVVRLDAGGRKLWDQSFGGSQDEFLYSVAVTTDGGVILGGFSDSGPSGNKTSPNYGGNDYWVVRLDSDGQKLWDAAYGGSRTDELKALLQTADGGFILGGFSWSPADGVKTVPDFSFGDYWVIKLGPEKPYLQVSDLSLSPDGLRLWLTGIKNLTYRIERSSNLLDWTGFQTNRLTNSVLPILDASATKSGQRFYRVNQIP